MSCDFLKEKSILITGGTGSFGQKFVKYLLEKSQAAKIIIFSRDELKQSQMEASFLDPQGRLRFFIGDIRDEGRLRRAFSGVNYVMHAAALKQVPALEYNPFEAVQTNVIGTQNVINAALDEGVEKVLLISTDKAANPANLYGATKLCAEKLIISGNAYAGQSGTRFGVVRYGNVFGSRGSIMDVIRRQKGGGCITLTHENMTRFWISMEQSMDLVLLALEKMYGGEIFIPKIPSMRVKELINILAPDCAIEVIGVRPGEKIHEVLITIEEARHAVEFKDYYVILPEHNWWRHRDKYTDARDLDEGFQYISDKNHKELTKESLQQLYDSLWSSDNQ